MNTPLNIEEFINLSYKVPVIDVRSPAEFQRGHIPGAYNVPLLNNEERVKVGTVYKQTGRQAAIKLGLELVGPKLSSLVLQTEKIIRNHSDNRASEHKNNSNSQQLLASHVPFPSVLIYCWRGGMRSANFAWLINLYGIKTYTLIKGYKAYRNFVLKNFQQVTQSNIMFYILGGETGSGKTEILKKIKEKGRRIIDLEALACHKGSAFGSLGEKPQPTQEQFENNLFDELLKTDSLYFTIQKTNSPSLFYHAKEPELQKSSFIQPSTEIWLEDESRNIGSCQIPDPIWEKMKQAPIIRINVPKEKRIQRLVNNYGKFSKEELSACILKIHKRVGPQYAKQAIEELEKGNLRLVANIMLTYYDKAYNYQHEKRNFKNVFFIECETADAELNAEKIVEFVKTSLKRQQSTSVH